MPVPRREHMKGNWNRRVKPGNRIQTQRIIGILALCFAASLFVSFFTTNKIVDQQDRQHSPEKKQLLANEVPTRSVGTEPLKHEDAFLATIKSCLPETNPKCKTYIPEHTTTQRVGLLAPPGDMTNAFLRLLHVVVERAKRKKPTEIDIQLIPTTHMAPYGYGKTHGWTRIIRVVPQPLLLGATNTLQAVSSGKTDDITVEDIKSALRQQIRYHCRLSHVAAHTALWSLNLESLVNLPMADLIDQIQRFLGLDRVDIQADIEVNHLAVTNDDLVPPDDLEHRFNAMSAAGASLLTLAQTKIKDDILSVLDDVLVREMKISKDLTAWPCESFWTVGNETGDVLSLSPLVAQMAKEMSPDCSAPFTSCFVQRDKCEFSGDGKCANG